MLSGQYEVTLSAGDPEGTLGTQPWMYEDVWVRFELSGESVRVIEGGDTDELMYPEGHVYHLEDDSWQVWLSRGAPPSTDNLDFWLIHGGPGGCLDARAVHRSSFTWVDWFGYRRESWSSQEVELSCELTQVR